MKTCTVTITLTIRGHIEDALDAVNAALDSGVLQDSVNSDDVEITDALVSEGEKKGKARK